MSASIRRIECGQPTEVVVAELLGELSEQQWTDALSWLMPLESLRYESEPIGRAERFLAGRFLLRTLGAQLFDCAPGEVGVHSQCLECGGEHGAPVISRGARRMFASLSHAGDNRHTAALSERFRVGIDIENPREDVDLVQWTEREAVSKLDGQGLREPEFTPGGAQSVQFVSDQVTGCVAWAPSPR